MTEQKVEQVNVEYDGVMTYIGVSASGVGESDAQWSVTRIEHDAAGKVIEILHSGGIADQVYAWDERKNLEYL